MARTFDSPLLPTLAALLLVAATVAKAAMLPAPAPAAASQPLPALSAADPPALTEVALQAALPGHARRVSPAELNRIAASQSHRGHFLTGPALASLLAATDSAETPPPAAARLCRQPDSLREKACLDSLARAEAALDRTPRALRPERSRAPDTVVLGGEKKRDKDRGRVAATEDEVQEARNRGYIAQLFVDMREGDMDWDADDWAVVLYVVVGVIVVGAFVLVGAKALYDLAINKEQAPVFKEAGVRYSYSGHSMRDHGNPDLYRDAHMAGGRFAFGLKKDVLALGLAVEGGALNLRLSGLDGPEDVVDFRAAYLMGGPMVRFGEYRPLAFSMEFLNGASSHRSIGWISKARMVLQAKTGPGILVGGHLGAVFYDLEFADGLAFRRGVFNRDLSLLMGVDMGWEF